MNDLPGQSGEKPRDITLSASLATGPALLRTDHILKREMHRRIPYSWREPSVALGRFTAGDIDVPLVIQTVENGASISSVETKLHLKIDESAAPVQMKPDLEFAAWFAKELTPLLMQFPRFDPPDGSSEPVVTWYLQGGFSSRSPSGGAPAIECMLICDHQVLGSALAYGVTDAPWGELPSSARPSVIWRGDLKPLVAANRVYLRLHASEEAARRSVTHNEFVQFDITVPVDSATVLQMDKPLVNAE